MTKQTPKKGHSTFISINDISTPKNKAPHFALFTLAFRPFFLLACVFSIVHLLAWIMVWLGKLNIDFPSTAASMTSFLWHGHEMVFGYSYGVVIGFLLTAVVNWTGEKTLSGTPLALMAGTWLLARIAFFVGGSGFFIAAVADLILSIWFAIEFTRPVVLTKNHRQSGFVSKLISLVIANGLFYLGLFGIIPNGERYGVYLGLYLILAIVLVMGRRVIPFFTKRALGLSEDLQNPKWLDITSIILFTIFAVWDTFYTPNDTLAILSLTLFALYNIRLYNWYQKGIFEHPLIWVLWLAVSIFNLGFLFKALAILGLVYPYLFIHAFALGGIGLMTLGMMARVSLGHTGRSVFDPPKILTPIFLIMVAAISIRVILPLSLMSQYKILIMISVTLWAIAFGLFLSRYASMLVKSRVDEKLG